MVANNAEAAVNTHYPVFATTSVGGTPHDCPSATCPSWGILPSHSRHVPRATIRRSATVLADVAVEVVSGEAEESWQRHRDALRHHFPALCREGSMTWRTFSGEWWADGVPPLPVWTIFIITGTYHSPPLRAAHSNYSATTRTAFHPLSRAAAWATAPALPPFRTYLPVYLLTTARRRTPSPPFVGVPALPRPIPVFTFHAARTRCLTPSRQ